MTPLGSFFVIINIAIFARTWDLRKHGVGINYYVSSVSVYRNRAFLTLPRSSCYNNLTNPTLIEVPWTGEYNSIQVRRPILFLSEEGQYWGVCTDLQDAVSIDIETKSARLWVLDRGTKKCSPTVVVYNIRTNMKLKSFVLKNIPNPNLNYLLVDSQYAAPDTRAYVAQDGDNNLLVFSFQNEKWWKVKLMGEDGLSVSTIITHLALSKTDHTLYLTGSNSEELYSLKVNDIRRAKNLTNKSNEYALKTINATFIGRKLGPSGGMVTDLKDGLSYYLTRDFAIVRWDTGKPLVAEYHDVLAQSYEALPYVPHLFVGPQNGIWALVNPLRPLECSPAQRNRIWLPRDIPHLRTRVIKLLKYVKKGNEKDILNM